MVVFFHGTAGPSLYVCGKYEAPSRQDAIQVPDLIENDMKQWRRLSVTNRLEIPSCSWRAGAQHVSPYGPGDYDPELVVPILLYAGDDWGACKAALLTATES